MSDEVRVHCLSTALSTARPGNPDKGDAYQPWVVEFATTGYSVLLPSSKATADSEVQLGGVVLYDRFFIYSWRISQEFYWSLKDSDFGCHSTPPDVYWLWANWYLQSTQDDGKLQQYLTYSPASGKDPAWITVSLTNFLKPDDESNLWHQFTEMLFIPVPVNLTPQYTMNSDFWRQALLPQVVVEFHFGPFFSGKSQTSIQNASFDPQTANVQYAMDGTAFDAVLDSDGTYSVKTAGSSGASELHSVTIRPQRWFDHWPSSFPDIKNPALCAPENVANSMEYEQFERIDATDPNKVGWYRYKVQAMADEKLFHAFFNGPYGYRARYFAAEALGLQYELAVITAIKRNKSFQKIAGVHVPRFEFGTKIWVNTKRERTDVKILNGVWEQAYILKVLGKSFKEIEGAGLRCSDAIPHTLHKESIYKGIRVDSIKIDSISKKNMTRLEIKSPWFHDHKVVPDPGKAKRALEVSAIGFV